MSDRATRGGRAGTPGAPRGTPGFLLRYLDLRRLALASFVLAALFGAFYFAQWRDARGGGPAAEPARMVETPKGSGGVAPGAGLPPHRLSPDFEASGLDGARFRLSDFRGRPVVVNLWATWCTSCLAELPELKEVQAERREDGLAVVAVNVGEGTRRAREFMAFLEAPFQVAMDPSLTVADAYGVRGLPVSVFLDREGVVRGRYVGQTDREVLDRFVAAAVQAAPASDPPPKLRFVTTVPREHVLYVEQTGRGTVRLASKSLRCDESYCVEGVERALAAIAGVSAVRREASDPPAFVVRFEITGDAVSGLVETLVELLESRPDPLYDMPLKVLYESP